MANRVAWFANIRVGVDALQIHPLRTMLSVLGIIIGAGSLVATMAVSDGMMGFARGQIERETSVQVISIGSRTTDYHEGQWIAISNYPVFTLGDAQAAQREIRAAQSVTMMLSGSAVYPVLSLNTVLLAIASSSLVGLAFGTYPARRAARLPPIEAIAHE